MIAFTLVVKAFLLESLFLTSVVPSEQPAESSNQRYMIRETNTTRCMEVRLQSYDRNQVRNQSLPLNFGWTDTFMYRCRPELQTMQWEIVEVPEMQSESQDGLTGIQIRNVQTEKCLSIKKCTTVQDRCFVALQLGCNRSNPETLWTLKGAGERRVSASQFAETPIEITSFQNQQCLQATHIEYPLGSQISAFPCEYASGGQWTLDKVSLPAENKKSCISGIAPTLANFPVKTYRLKMGGYACMEGISLMSSDDGPKVFPSLCRDPPTMFQSMLWELVQIADFKSNHSYGGAAAYLIRNLQTQKCLTAEKCSRDPLHYCYRYDIDNTIVQFECSEDQPTGVWFLQTDETKEKGKYKIITPLYEKCVTMTKRPPLGTPLELAQCNPRNMPPLWTLEEVSVETKGQDCHDIQKQPTNAASRIGDPGAYFILVILVGVTFA